MPYSPEERERLMNAVLAEMEGGLSLRQAARVCGVAASTIVWWCDQDPEGSEQYERARARLIDVRLDEMERIADDASRDIVETDDGREIVQHEVIARSRLRIEQRRWELTKLMPKRFGDKTQHEHGGKDGGPIALQVVTGVERADD